MARSRPRRKPHRSHPARPRRPRVDVSGYLAQLRESIARWLPRHSLPLIDDARRWSDRMLVIAAVLMAWAPGGTLGQTRKRERGKGERGKGERGKGDIHQNAEKGNAEKGTRKREHSSLSEIMDVPFSAFRVCVDRVACGAKMELGNLEARASEIQPFSRCIQR